MTPKTREEILKRLLTRYVHRLNPANLLRCVELMSAQKIPSVYYRAPVERLEKDVGMAYFLPVPKRGLQFADGASLEPERNVRGSGPGDIKRFHRLVACLNSQEHRDSRTYTYLIGVLSRHSRAIDPSNLA